MQNVTTMNETNTFRLATWNLHHAFASKAEVSESWRFLESLEVDIALVQEAKRPPFAGPVGRTVGGRRNWGSWIVPFGVVALREVPWVRLGTPRPKGALVVSHAGTFAAAEVTFARGASTIAISAYGLMNPTMNGAQKATATLHRSLSDLSPLLDVKRSKGAVVLAGDLNVSPQIKEPDTAAHEALIQRIKAFGMRDCLGETHDDYVRTFGGRDGVDAVGFQGDGSSRATACVPPRARRSIPWRPGQSAITARW